MKKNSIALICGILGFQTMVAQVPPTVNNAEKTRVINQINTSLQNVNCDCSVALRYDVYRSSRNFYSQMLLARDITKENYKYIEQEASGGLNIFGIKLSADGSNIQEIKDKYHEYMKDERMVHDLAEYESTTTSSASYNAYTNCLQICNKDKNGITLLVDREDASNVWVNVYYFDDKSAPPIKVNIDAVDTNFTVSVPSQRRLEKSIKMRRPTKSAFTILATSPKYADNYPIKAWKPIILSYEVIYTHPVEETLPPIYTSRLTENNDYRSCSFLPKYTDNLGALASFKDRIPINQLTYLLKMCEAGIGSDVTFIRCQAPSGYKIKNEKIDFLPHGDVASHSRVDQLYKSETETFYSIATSSFPITITYEATPYRIISKTEPPNNGFTTSTMFNIVLPKDYTGGKIQYDGGSIDLHGNSDKLRFVSEFPVGNDKVQLSFQVLKPDN